MICTACQFVPAPEGQTRCVMCSAESPSLELVTEALRTFAPPEMVARVLAAGGAFERTEDRSSLLLNAHCGGFQDGWHWIADARGLGFGLRAFAWTVRYSPADIAEALIAAGGDVTEAARLLVHPAPGLEQLSLLEGL